jgi:outer membrane lipoprotein
MMTRLLASALLLSFTTLAACATSGDPSFDAEPGIAFSQLRGAPDSFKGQPVVLGGEVLNAKRLKEGTRIEVLQLPLTSSRAPVSELGQSQGRFLAMQREFLDPATIPQGTHITVTGDVAGSQTMPLDETDYTYPVIEVREIKVWPQLAEAPYPIRPYPYYPYWGPFWGPYWGPYWRPYPYW